MAFKISLVILWHLFPLGKNVHLSFQEFELEDEADCGYDFIEVFSGFDDSGSLHGRFCGVKVDIYHLSTNWMKNNTFVWKNPPEIISVEETLLLRFKSDDTLNAKGFTASYVVIDEADNFDYQPPGTLFKSSKTTVQWWLYWMRGPSG